MSIEEGEHAKKAAIETVTAAIGAGAGLTMGGPIGGMAGAVITPGLTRAATALFEQIQIRRHQRTIDTIAAVARSLNVEESELVPLLTSDERVLELTSRIVRSAQDISSYAKRRALSLALAMAASDPAPATLDTCELLHEAITRIDAPHIRFMHSIQDAEPLPDPGDPAPDEHWYGMSLEQVFQRDEGLREGGHAILQRLLSLGLVESCARGIGGMADRNKPYALSPLGQNLLQLLREDAV
ncbi:hypothetical protein [Streptomyces kronopolitis]